MIQNRATGENNAKRFIERVRDSGVVWSLITPEGDCAYCPSHDHDDTDVLVFWSDQAYAARQVKEDWAEYDPTPIELSEFLECWLPGMMEDGVLIGPNWDAHLFGIEMHPKAMAELLGVTK
ncbi:DUF2750 domain-containing protein [Verrucomicrobiaceae bacterium R5-34]|nr:DUF2750 domain-containing protein [Verrucomicrobiaceae bacterium R5-34]